MNKWVDVTELPAGSVKDGDEIRVSYIAGAAGATKVEKLVKPEASKTPGDRFKALRYGNEYCVVVIKNDVDPEKVTYLVVDAEEIYDEYYSVDALLTDFELV